MAKKEAESRTLHTFDIMVQDAHPVMFDAPEWTRVENARTTLHRTAAEAKGAAERELDRLNPVSKGSRAKFKIAVRPAMHDDHFNRKASKDDPEN